MAFSDIFLKQEQLLPKGLRVKVTRMNASDPVHGVVLGDTLYKVIEEEAKAHGEPFDGRNFDKVLEAIQANKIQAHFLIVNGMGPLPRVVGGAIQFSTVFTEWNGESFLHYPAVYSEDTYVSSESSSAFRKLTEGGDFPRGIGLGTYFVCERIRLAVSGEKEDRPFGLSASCRVAEHAAGNAQIMGIYKKLCATQEVDRINTVLQFEEFPPHLDIDTHITVQVHSLSSCMDGCDRSHPNVFVVTWASSDRKERLSASFTEALSTFTGAPLVRVQFTSNGALSSSSECSLKKVLSAILSAGEAEIVNRGWIGNGSDSVFSAMKLHALHEPRIVNTLRNMGAVTRLLGVRPMQPTVIDFRNIPSEIFGQALPVAVPFTCRSVDALPRFLVPMGLPSAKQEVRATQVA